MRTKVSKNRQMHKKIRRLVKKNRNLTKTYHRDHREDDLEQPEDLERLEHFELFDERETEIKVRNVTMEFKRGKRRGDKPERTFCQNTEKTEKL